MSDEAEDDDDEDEFLMSCDFRDQSRTFWMEGGIQGSRFLRMHHQAWWFEFKLINLNQTVFHW